MSLTDFLKKDGKPADVKRLELLDGLLADLKEAKAVSTFTSCAEAKTYYDLLERTKENLLASADRLFRDMRATITVNDNVFETGKLADRTQGKAEGIAMAQALMKISLEDIAEMEERIKKLKTKEKEQDKLSPAQARIR